MNTTTIRTFFLMSTLLLLGTAFTWADTPASEKKKEYNQTFAVSSADQLRIENKYGNITVVHWDRNEVAIRVVVEAKANTDSRAQALLDRISIDMGKSGSTVSAVTSIKSGTMNGGKSESMTINYFITMPSSLTSNLAQSYGNINLPDKNDGLCNIDIRYGNAKGGSFTKELIVEARYSDLDFKDLSKTQMNISYAGKVVFRNSAEASIDGKYSNVETGDVQSLNAKISYGELKAGRVNNASLELRYSEGTIAAIQQEMVLGQLSYSNMTVRELSADFANVTARASYGNLNLSIPSRTGFTVTAEAMKYGNVDIKGFNDQTRKEGSSIYSVVNNGGTKYIRFDGGNYSNLKIRSL